MNPDIWGEDQVTPRDVMATLFARATSVQKRSHYGSVARTGCPDDLARAREAVKIALDAWKEADLVDAVAAVSLPITGDDIDWMAGLQLVNYELGAVSEHDDFHFRLPVELTVRLKHGKELNLKLTYLVDMSATISVFQDV